MQYVDKLTKILSESNDVAATTLKQFGGTKALTMIGGTAYYDGNDLIIKFKASKKANYVKIHYDKGADLYDMTIGKASGVNLKTIFDEKGLYAEDLRDIFERKTGLYLTL